MNLPLNIDWQQILLHMFNLIILGFGLYLLLYKPVKAFMDKREAYYKDLDDSANKKNEDADKLLKEYQDKLAKADEEIKEKKNIAMKELDDKVNSELNKAKEDAKRIVEDAKAQGQKKHDELVESANKDICDLAIKATGKLVDKTLDDSYDEFLLAVKKEK
ncbi:MAG: ATP synthase F0 subunit B [Solobacterium sp.]|nr:ATP synthase F0 subunit B [Solobacterium sp.]MDY4494229.1 ATP synthase F0 subunit B [Erysipelotrichaceae bacterium]MDY5277681.1 ATP synthase F0 subunit B [Erysipelotrichaceae bacterium]